MKKKILIISSSLRTGSNSEALALAFANGAQNAGHTVETVSLKGRNIAFCRGCLACQHSGRCVIGDDAPAIAEKMKNADVLVFATPVYYYGMSGQLKTMLDRANQLFASDYAFRSVYLLMTAAEDEPHTSQGTEAGIRWWAECFEKAHFAGSVFAGGVTGAGSISGHPALQQAYLLGASVK